MKSLQTIQKTFRVFQVLAKIALVFCIVIASICAVGALCAVARYTGGEVFTLFGEPVTVFSSGEGMNQTLAALLSNLVFLIAQSILLSFVGRYLKTEQAEGTPFTQNGANLLRRLGVRCIWIPIVAIVIAAVITVCLGAERSGELSNLPSLTTGVILILVSLIFQYGAELEAENQRLGSAEEKPNEMPKEQE